MFNKLISYKDKNIVEYRWFNYVFKIDTRIGKSYLFYVDYGENDCTGLMFSLFEYKHKTKIEFEWYFEEEGYLFFDLTFNLFNYCLSISMFS